MEFLFFLVLFEITLLLNKLLQIYEDKSFYFHRTLNFKYWNKGLWTHTSPWILKRKISKPRTYKDEFIIIPLPVYLLSQPHLPALLDIQLGKPRNYIFFSCHLSGPIDAVFYCCFNTYMCRHECTHTHTHTPSISVSSPHPHCHFPYSSYSHCLTDLQR